MDQAPGAAVPRPFTSPFARLAILALLALAQACGQSALYRKLSSMGKIQADLDSGTLSLWNRSPTLEANDLTLSGADDLDKVPRQSVELPDLLSKTGGLESDYLTVEDAASSGQTVPFTAWAGRRAPWDGDDFQMLMAYAHATKALNYFKTIFPNATYGFKAYDGAKLVSLKLGIFAAEVGSVFDTSYDPKYKAISFYRHSGADNYSRFNPVLESEAVYHEMGHYLMHSLTCASAADCAVSTTNVVAMNPGENPDMDALQEGLADLYASTMAGHDRNFTFFNNNARELVSTQTRTGIDFYRQTGNDLYFPDGYRQAPHLDGRVVAGALNDFRKYLNGQSVRKVNCTVGVGETCLYDTRATALTLTKANEYLTRLAFTAFKDMTRRSTFQDYAKKLLELCVVGPNCPDAAANTRLGLLLARRGLISGLADAGTLPAIVISNNQNASDVFIYPDLGWVPFPDDNELADADAYLEPCELIMVYPRIGNLTASGRPKQLALENLKVSLQSVTNFSEVSIGGESLDPFPTNTFKPLKLLGWLNPTEETQGLVNSATSRLYTVKGQSTFTRKFGKDFQVPSMGWLMFAPDDLGKTGTLTFKISVRAFNTRAAVDVVSDPYSVTLSTLTAAEANAAQAAGGRISRRQCGF